MKWLWKRWLYAWRMFELQLWYDKQVARVKKAGDCRLWGPTCKICSPGAQGELEYLDREYRRVRGLHRADLKK